MNTQLKAEDVYQNLNRDFQSIPQELTTPVIEGFFPEELDTVKSMAIRRLNTILCIMLGVVILITSISYYFATANEMTLNELSRQTTALNDENSELQIKLDRLKSFNNVDITMQQSNMLQKAKQVIEIPQVAGATVSESKFDDRKPFTWAIGY